MIVPLKRHMAKYNKVVYLRKDLPVGALFGNRQVILAKNGGSTKGYIVSQGFEAGMVRVLFPLHQGDEKTQFNELSAEAFLECDPFF